MREDAMPAAENRAMLKRLFDEAVSGGRMGVVDEVVAPDYVNHNMPGPPGPEGFKQITGMFRAAFPDLRIVVEDTVADGEKVAQRGVATGTHRGDFMGIPATGKQISFSFIDIWLAENGRLKENWVQLDMLGLMQQLGAAPSGGG
jgi:steroid delta-isomerase-like uncharacterized protein